MKMKKCVLLLCAVCGLGGVGVVMAAGAYGLVSLPAPGLWTPTGVGVAKIAQVQVTGSAVDTGTVVLSRVSADNVTTQQLVSVTCSNGAVTTNVQDAVYLVDGDRLLRSGTATNGACRIIVEQ